MPLIAIGLPRRRPAADSLWIGKPLRPDSIPSMSANGGKRDKPYFFQLSFYPTKPSQPPHLSQEEIALETYCLPHFNPARFEPRSEGGALTVDFRDYLYDPLRNRAICRVAVIEDGLFQDFWIEINHKPEGWRAVPSDGCLIVPTMGVQRALDLVKEAMIRSVE